MVERQIVERLENLMTSYADDARAIGMLSAMRDDVHNIVSAIPKKLKNDLNTVLRLLVNAKTDNAELWGQVVGLSEEIKQLKEELKDTREEVKDLHKKLELSHDQLAVRQIYHALNEKLLREVCRVLHISTQALWDKKVSNVGALRKRADTKSAWEKIAQRLNITDSAGDFWEELKDGKHEFDIFVHDGSYPEYSYEELQGVAERVFVGDMAKHKVAFLEFLEVNHKLSLETGQSLYKY
jgi:chromosome segregation ATPase